ncbi:MAG: SDR family oxidoreductase [Nocardioidaceae bacterium]|nr:SDR family oxidoreductase [Nocardioidaceae bacterium]
MKNILITGSSTGIGAATALHLDKQGMRVFAGVRDLTDGEELRAAASPELRVLKLDVTDEVSIAAAITEVTDELGDEGLQGLVNNAGEAYPGPLEVVPLEQLREQLEVNVIGPVAMTRAALPLLRRSAGRVVFVGSVGGKGASVFGGPYHASKFAIEAIGDAWRQELEPEGISVVIVEPGPISTPIWSKGVQRIEALLAGALPETERYRERLTNYRKTLIKADEYGGSPQDVAQVIEKALTESRPSTRYPVGATARLATVVKPLVPDRLYDAVSRRAVK